MKIYQKKVQPAKLFHKKFNPSDQGFIFFSFFFFFFKKLIKFYFQKFYEKFWGFDIFSLNQLENNDTSGNKQNAMYC